MVRLTQISLTLLAGALLAVAPAQPASAQTTSAAWPQNTVRFIVPLPPGSGMDLSARLLAERLAERWGQSVVVENRQGADGIPAVTAFLSARDNHTFLFSFAGIVTFNHLLHDKLPYDPGELLPIVPVIDNYLGVSATAVLKANTLADFVEIAKARPNELNWAATPGLPYYVLLALQRSAGIKLVQVGYRNFAPAYQDLNQGRLHLAGTGVPTLVPHHRAGTAKMLFVTNRDRSPQAPDVPTAREAGYPDLTFEGTAGIYGWRNMPPTYMNARSGR
jgi:tripartite-type tricarboxylate transporter receptor subunit TctC